MSFAVQKVVAYITRRCVNTPHELLVFAHKFMPEVPIQVPTGTVDFGETPEIALFREIEEESGLVTVKLVRKLGIHEFTKAGNLGLRHYYLLETTTTTLDDWDHEVKGSGLDAGLVFSYRWTTAERGFEVDESQTAFLNQTAVPELF